MFRCRDLLSLPNMSKAKLITGERGLENGIRWAYKAENMEFASWVHGQELLIVSTPIINSVDFDLHRVIEDAIRMRLAGVLLLEGEDYVSSIEVKTIALADRNSLPIISIPGDIPLVDILEELGHAIVFQDKKQSVYGDFLAELVFGNRIEPQMISKWAELIGYDLKENQRVFMVHFTFSDDANVPGLMELMSGQLEVLFNTQGSAAVLSHFHTNLIGLTGEESEDKLNKIFDSYFEWINSRKSNVNCRVGIGSSYEEPEMLNKSFSEASSALKLANPVQWYEKLGFIKILVDVEDQKKMNEYMRQILGDIIKHDNENNSELLNTLIAYFDCNENMKEVGSRIFIHPNTVKYRLSQIQEICGLNLSVTNEKMELYNALLIWRLLENGC